MVQKTSAKGTEGGARATRQPSERFYHSATVLGTKMYVIGGTNGNKLFNDVWTLELQKGPAHHQWIEIVAAVSPPSPLQGAPAASAPFPSPPPSCH